MSNPRFRTDGQEPTAARLGNSDLSGAPRRRAVGRGDYANHRVSPSQPLVQTLLPLIPDAYAVAQMPVEEHLMTNIDQPTVQIDRRGVVRAGVADEHVGHHDTSDPRDLALARRTFASVQIHGHRRTRATPASAAGQQGLSFPPKHGHLRCGVSDHDLTRVQGSKRDGAVHFYAGVATFRVEPALMDLRGRPYQAMAAEPGDRERRSCRRSLPGRVVARQRLQSARGCRGS
jgi:hypothetical protein